MTERAAVRLIFMMLAACGPSHVSLRPLPTGLSPEARVDTYKALGPDQQRDDLISFDGRKTWELDSTSVKLGNGTIVEAPEDLIQVTGPASQTARAARASVKARRTRTLSLAITTATFLVGAWLSGVFRDEPPTRLSPHVGYGTLVVSAIVSGVLERHFKAVEMDERKRAFRTYATELGDVLQVCAEGFKVVACERAGFAPAK